MLLQTFTCRFLAYLMDQPKCRITPNRYDHNSHNRPINAGHPSRSGNPTPTDAPFLNRQTHQESKPNHAPGYRSAPSRASSSDLRIGCLWTLSRVSPTDLPACAFYSGRRQPLLPTATRMVSHPVFFLPTGRMKPGPSGSGKPDRFHR